MADFTALKKRRSTLGTPPEEASTNTQAPEVAPATPAVPPLVYPVGPKVDGRTLRRSNRSVQLGTKVTPEFDARLRALAAREGVSIVEMLEKLLASYEG